jgi:hypothetical protein
MYISCITHYQTMCISTGHPPNHNTDTTCSTVLVSISTQLHNQQNIVPSSNKTVNTVEYKHKKLQKLRYGMKVVNAERTSQKTRGTRNAPHTRKVARRQLQPVCLPCPHCRSMRQAITSLLAQRPPHHPAIGPTCHQYSMIG